MASPVHIDTSEKPNKHFLAPPETAGALSPTESREAASRLVDDLELLRAERIVSNQENEARRSRSKNRRDSEHEDAFNTVSIAVPTMETKEKKPTFLNKLWEKLKNFPRVLRYLLYWLPAAVVLLTPILIAVYAVDTQSAPVGGKGGVLLLWFGIWLEIVWGVLWASRIITAVLPMLFGAIANMVGSSNHKKWKDIGSQLEFPTALFLWLLGVLCSFLPIMNSHRASSGDWSDGRPYIKWIDIVNKVIIALFVLAALNLVEKILIQWIATSFHLRTYAYRIEQNKLEINFLVQLYEYSKIRIAQEDPIWDSTTAQGGTSGTRTPMKAIQNNARQAWNQIGNVANKMAGDFTGRKLLSANHPRKVVIELLRTTSTAHTLARLIYRTLARDNRATITLDDMKEAFANPEDAEGCFGIFDKDLNGDISMEELEIVCNEIHLEKKAIAASLKDLDSVISKLDRVFLFIIFIIAAIVFISVISGSAASALASAGTTILGLSWLLQATAQEFLQSIIFVFVKHPFDVGDRVTIYGNTGSMMRGDDYYVQEISLLYTEFKKMEGHVVQAPNSLLNTLFILNQRRSNGLADPIELKLRFGTPNDVIDELKARMLEFVTENKRDYAPRIITEVRTIDEVWSVTMNFIFFHKSNFQNELLRLQRHNKFAAELMRQMSELGIEGPRKMEPGGTKDFPFYWASIQPPAYQDGHDRQRDISPAPQLASPVLQRRRAETSARAFDAGPEFQDVFETRKEPQNLARLQSIRNASPVAPRATGIDRTSLEKVRSSESDTARRRGIFGRPRSASRPQGPPAPPPPPPGGPSDMV
ncbi:putative mechanosensitive ion channel family protein [Phaeoacremonium minimum UCRPA7]|uniref:Mechanosensitive ion channel protein n=1 Tax=Phaeoacremonium minimum (strain UCR-PA7) TaxID=1286976 RepID=R8BHB2_PHAM7|nr:putative mechanosensitive ion channel family protein [Phaeoacremonium minimum UCRPA7]EON98691.1 putative mechanosensitive ion channel family protein [Phaeoacremonium minimum UCRPA7]